MAYPDLSVIIVNYNVKEYIASLILSIRSADYSGRIHITVVDNASSDGSEDFLTSRFPDISFVANSDNLGFAKANNQAIRTATTPFTLIINPDTLIRNDTLRVMADFMLANPDVGAAGCKLLNPDGSFAPESKRAVPTPLTALYKIIGLSRLFPSSRRFADYHLGWLDADTTADVPVLSGSFMFCRTEVLQSIGGFDERFFMYGEDIDLCYRITLAGHRIVYVPQTSIIHYKGESTKKDRIDYAILFNRAMYQFFDKHYSTGYALWFKLLVKFGILVRGVASYLLTLAQRMVDLMVDLLVLNLLLVALLMWRYAIPPEVLTSSYLPGFLVLHGLASLLFVAIATYHDLYGHHRGRTGPLLSTMFLTFAALAFITFFLRDYAYSRWVVLLGWMYGSILLWLVRRLRSWRSADSRTVPRWIVIGAGSETDSLITTLTSRLGGKAEFVGVVLQHGLAWTDRVAGLPVVGRLDHTADLVRYHQVTQILFDGSAVSTGDILSVMSQIRSPEVSFKLVPKSMDFIIGKSDVEYIDKIPLVDVDVPLNRPWNRFMKRNLDVAVSIPAVFLLLIPGLIGWVRARRMGVGLQQIRIPTQEHRRTVVRLYLPYSDAVWANRFRCFAYVLAGKLSLVGAPIMADRSSVPVYYPPGLTGLRQQLEASIASEDEKARLEQRYVQSHTIWLDVLLAWQALTNPALRTRYL